VLRWIFEPKRGEVTEVEKTTQQEALLCSVFLTKSHSGDQVNNTEMGRACSMQGKQQRCIQKFSGETSGTETTWKTQA
jgi:hypothetical protein